MSKKHSDETIGNLTRDLQACSAAIQTTAPLRAPPPPSTETFSSFKTAADNVIRFMQHDLTQNKFVDYFPGTKALSRTANGRGTLVFCTCILAAD